VTYRANDDRHVRQDAEEAREAANREKEAP